MAEQPLTGYPSVIEYVTMSGVIIHITPLSTFTVQAIRARSEQALPYPDPEPYRIPLKNAVDPAIKDAPENNPEYQALCKPIDAERAAWRVETCIDLACDYPQFPDRDFMMAHFRPMLERLKAVAVMPEDEWQAVLKCCVFTGRKDRENVLDLALQNHVAPLSMPEVVDGLRLFRLELQK